MDLDTINTGDSGVPVHTLIPTLYRRPEVTHMDSRGVLKNR